MKRVRADEDDTFENIPDPKEVECKNVREIKLLYFQPESVPSDFSAILYGQRRTGKTTWLTWFLYTQQGKFDHVVCFSATNFSGHYAQHMNPKLCYNTYDEEVLEKVLEIQKNTPKSERARVLVILDDVIDQEGLLRRSRALKALFSMGRHYSVSVVVCTQYAKCIPTSWRRNVDFACIFYTFSRDMSDIYYREYGMLLSRCQFNSVLTSATKDYRALVVRPCTQSQEIRDVFQLTLAMPHRSFTIGELPKKKVLGLYDEEN